MILKELRSRSSSPWLGSSPAVLLGFVAVAAVRLLTLPASLWEWDEVLFVKGVEHFDPVHHQPHPPGYPLLIGLGKLLNVFLRDPFVSLVTLSVVSCLIGYLALVSAFRRLAGGPNGPDAPAAERIAVLGALLFHFSPTMLVYGPLALSDAPALMFLALALAAAARLPDRVSPATAAAFGAFAAAAIGCRPQLAVATLPMVAVALVLAGGWKRWAAAVSAFTFVSLLWFVPLLVAVGGFDGFFGFLGKQAELFATYDAKGPRAWHKPAWIFFRFVAHPWGKRWSAFPLLALAVIGIVSLIARRRVRPALPLAVLCGIELGLCLFVMNPADGVRYALPSLIAIAFAAAAGCQALASRLRAPAGAYVPAALLMAGFVFYTSPLLAARTRALSPPAQAVRWLQRSVPRSNVLLIDKELAAHASYLLQDYPLIPIEEGMQRYAREPGTPLFLVADGRSEWPNARTFEWPLSDPYGKLTRNLYRVVSVSPIPPERRYEVIRGVYTYEPRHRMPRWRWLDDDAVVRLYPPVPGEGRAASVVLRLPRQASLPSVRVTVSVPGGAGELGESIELDIPRGQMRSAMLPLPPSGPVDVRFRSSAWFNPRPSGQPGSRRLAVQLLSLRQIRR